MRIKYTVTVDDLLFFNEHHFGKNKQIQKMLLRKILIFCLSFAVIMAYFAYKSGAWSYSIVVGVIACILYAFTSKPRYKKRLRKMLKKKYEEKEDKDVLGVQELETTEEHLIGRSQVSETKTKWNGITEVDETPEYALIYTGISQAYVVRRGSVDEGDLKEFLREVKMKTNVERKAIQS